MQMDLKGIAKTVRESVGKNVGNPMGNEETGQSKVDAASALQIFLDRIPVNSISGIRNSSVIVELSARDSVEDAIHKLYRRNVSGALITDPSDSSLPHTRKFFDPYIGFVDFATMFLWLLEKCDQLGDSIEMGNGGFFEMLRQNPEIGQTKVGELAKSFLWDPFLPIHLEDTLFHVLLLFSKHRVRVAPVIEGTSSRVIGFVTQNAVVQVLLQSSGLEWFDSVADKALCQFRLENGEHAVQIYCDQPISEALQLLQRSNTCAIAVVDRQTERIVGSLRHSDIHLLLDDNIFRTRKSFTVEEFMRSGSKRRELDPAIEPDNAAFILAGSLHLRNDFLPKMDEPVTTRKTDSLKRAMKNLSETRSSSAFLIDESQKVTGLLTLRDVIVQFAPPCVDSRIDGCGFFRYALEQTGCRVENGTMIQDH